MLGQTLCNTPRVSSLAIEVVGLTKSFGGDTSALSGVEFSVPAGTVCGLLGPNGAGKTTTINILSTLIRPTSGAARVNGYDVVAESAKVRRSIATSGQFTAVDQLLTGRENLVLFGRLRGLRRREAKARAEELLEQFDMVEAADRRLSTYSGGMMRRIDLATGRMDLELRECVPNGLFADEQLGRVYLPSCGWLDVYEMATGTELARVDLRRGFDPPFPLGPHFHRVTADVERGKAFVTYLETGRLYRVDGATGTLEAEAILGRGLRDVTWDARNGVVWIGNYVTGELLAVDPESLAVRGRVQVGRRIRSIEPSLDAKRIYVTSAVGGIAVNVATLLKR